MRRPRVTLHVRAGRKPQQRSKARARPRIPSAPARDSSALHSSSAEVGRALTSLRQATRSPVFVVLYVDGEGDAWCEPWTEALAQARPGDVEVRFRLHDEAEGRVLGAETDEDTP
jgi:hypothetical protein